MGGGEHMVEKEPEAHGLQEVADNTTTAVETLLLLLGLEQPGQQPQSQMQEPREEVGGDDDRGAEEDTYTEVLDGDVEVGAGEAVLLEGAAVVGT